MALAALETISTTLFWIAIGARTCPRAYPIAHQRLRAMHVDELLRQVGRHRGARFRVLDVELELAPAENAAGGIDLRHGALRRFGHVGAVRAGVAGEGQRYADRDRLALRVREVEIGRGQRGADGFHNGAAGGIHLLLLRGISSTYIRAKSPAGARSGARSVPRR